MRPPNGGAVILPLWGAFVTPCGVQVVLGPLLRRVLNQTWRLGPRDRHGEIAQCRAAQASASRSAHKPAAPRLGEPPTGREVLALAGRRIVPNSRPGGALVFSRFGFFPNAPKSAVNRLVA